MEMRMLDSTAIWTKSIAFCSSDPLAGIAVCRHFVHLALQVRTNGRADADDLASIEKFLHEQAATLGTLAAKKFRRDHPDWLANVAKEAPPKKTNAPTNGHSENMEHYDQSSELGFRTVRFFDALSLWLCCAVRHESEQLAAPMGEAVNLIPRNPSHITIEPYPLSVDSLRLETPARRLTARPFPTDKEFQSALSAAPIETLAWTIRPA
jgi:hypothetical protein